MITYLNNIQEFHFLRPWWLLAIVPLCLLCASLLRKQSPLQSWTKACDPQLLQQLLRMQAEKAGTKHYSGAQQVLLCLFLSGLCMILGLAGPAWVELPVPAYRDSKARVLVLDMSEAMMEKDLSPDRLTRAKFKLHDILSQAQRDQIALLVYTGQPFVVSPLTEDANTIDSLLEMLSPDIMPVGGQRLDLALAEAAKLIQQTGLHQGQILVLTSSPADAQALTQAKILAKKGIETSVLPVIAKASLQPLFKPLALAGKGILLNFMDTEKDFSQWLQYGATTSKTMKSSQNDIPLWRDEGLWFMLPALVLLLPVFRRNWLQRIDA